MKNLALFSLALLAFGFTSCKKCADCECVNTHTWVWDESSPYYSDSYRDQTEFNTEDFNDWWYEEDTKEYCERSKDLEEKIDKWEDNSATETESGFGDVYQYSFEHNCTCTEQ